MTLVISIVITNALANPKTIDINLFNESKAFDYKKPIKVIDKRKNLLGIGFLDKEQTNLNPKLVLNAK